MAANKFLYTPMYWPMRHRLALVRINKIGTDHLDSQNLGYLKADGDHVDPTVYVGSIFELESIAQLSYDNFELLQKDWRVD